MLKPFDKWESRFKKLNSAENETEIGQAQREPIEVFLRCVFERIIEIDTKSERFDAEVIIESSWFNDDVLKILLMPNYTKNYSSKTYLKPFNVWSFNEFMNLFRDC